MRRAPNLKRGLAQVRRASQAGRYDQALAAVDRLLQDWPDNPLLLTKRAQLIQLQDGGGPPLEDARSTLERAVALDEDSPVPLLELGHFLLSVADDAAAASKHFDKAIELCERVLKEALIAKADALVELDRRDEAVNCLVKALTVSARNGSSGNDMTREGILQKLEGLGRRS